MDIQIIEKIRGLENLVLAAQRIELPTVTLLKETPETIVAQVSCEILNFANVFCLIANFV